MQPRAGEKTHGALPALFLALGVTLALASCDGQRAGSSQARRSLVTPAKPDEALATIRVDATAGHVKGSFRPNAALGAGIDRMPRDAIEPLYAPEALKKILSAGWGAVASYRLNTELHAEAWHWNPRGTWSDPAGEGYFTGSVVPGEPIRRSLGYTLSRRGFTRNDGTEGNGFSRMMDGDARSFWEEVTRT